MVMWYVLKSTAANKSLNLLFLTVFALAFWCYRIAMFKSINS